jgi:hypothetical protein
MVTTPVSGFLPKYARRVNGCKFLLDLEGIAV